MVDTQEMSAAHELARIAALRTTATRVRWLVAVAIALLAAGAALLGPAGHEATFWAVVAAALLTAMAPAIGVAVAVLGPIAVLALAFTFGDGLHAHYWSTILTALAALLAPLAVTTLARRSAAAADTAAEYLERAQAKSIGNAVEEALAGGRRRNYVERELARAQRYDREVSLAIAEIDNLHLLRAQRGDIAAREALVELGSLFTNDTRLPDGGIGGGLSLVFVLPETPLLGGRIVVERVRLAFHKLGIEGADGIALTMSAGVACYPEDGQRSSDLLDAARIALKRAQAAGGNRTMLSRAVAGAPPGWSGLP